MLTCTHMYTQQPRGQPYSKIVVPYSQQDKQHPLSNKCHHHYPRLHCNSQPWQPHSRPRWSQSQPRYILVCTKKCLYATINCCTCCPSATTSSSPDTPSTSTTNEAAHNGYPSTSTTRETARNKPSTNTARKAARLKFIPSTSTAAHLKINTTKRVLLKVFLFFCTTRRAGLLKAFLFSPSIHWKSNLFLGISCFPSAYSSWRTYFEFPSACSSWSGGCCSCSAGEGSRAMQCGGGGGVQPHQLREVPVQTESVQGLTFLR